MWGSYQHTSLIECPGDNGCGAIHLGNFNASRDRKYMTQNNITHAVVALPKSQAKNPVFDELGIVQKIVPCEDDVEFNLFGMLDGVADFIHENVGNGNLFIHCMGGISRSPTCLIAFYIKHRQMTFEDALKFVKSKRKHVSPNEGFIEQLKQFEQIHLTK